jgi:hypothetical protein
MYKTNRNGVDGVTLMTCSDCGHAISLNKLCETPLQSATDMLKHMAAHNAARAFAQVRPVNSLEPQVAQEAPAVTSPELARVVSTSPDRWVTSILQSPN